VRVGRIATGVVVVLGILWIPIMANISGVLYEYLQKVQSYIAPPITAVFLFGIFYKRINARGAFAALVSGFLIGGGRIILELMKDRLTEGSWLHTLGTMNFLNFGAYFFLVSILILVGVSLATKADPVEKIKGLTFNTLTEEQKAVTKNSYNWIDVVASLLIIGIVVYVMITFS